MKIMNKIIASCLALIIILTLSIIPSKVYAASSSLSSDKTTVKAGDSVKFWANASGAMALDGNVNVGGSSIGTVQADADDNTSLKSNSVTYTFNKYYWTY